MDSKNNILSVSIVFLSDKSNTDEDLMQLDAVDQTINDIILQYVCDDLSNTNSEE